MALPLVEAGFARDRGINKSALFRRPRPFVKEAQVLSGRQPYKTQLNANTKANYY